MAKLLTLPNELILNVLSRLDINDLLSLTETNQDIKDIIIKNFDYIIKNIINNYEKNYYQMSILIACCIKKNAGYNYNLPNLKKICDFVSNVPKETIIFEFTDFINTIYYEEHKPNGQIIRLSKPYFHIYEMYYFCRVIKNISHIDALNASIYLEVHQFNKMLLYYKMNFEASVAINLAFLDTQQLISVKMLLKKKIDVKLAISAVNLLTNEGIIRALNICKLGINFEHAIDATVDELEDDEIDNMIELINEGIEQNFARMCSIYIEAHRRIIIDMSRKGIDIYILIDIIENFQDDKINGFVKMINKNIDVNRAFEIINDNEISEEQFSEFIGLIESNIECMLALNVIKNFTNIGIIKFVTITNLGVDAEIAYDVVDIFNNGQISVFLKLINEGIDVNAAYDMVYLYNENQCILCQMFIKNNLEYSLVESYDDNQTSLFIKLVYDENIDFNTAMQIVNNEPPAKRRR